MKKLLILIGCFFYFSFYNGQTVDSANITKKDELKRELKKLFHSKQIMMASLGAFQSKPSFINNDVALGSYRSYWYQDSYFILGIGNGSYLKNSEYYSNRKDTTSYNDISIGANFAFKKLSLGRRLWDINGILLTPQIGIAYNYLTFDGHGYNGLKIKPSLSLQFPYAAIDIRLNADMRKTNQNSNLKGFAVYPEIGIRLDGLFNVFEPTWVNNGHYEGTNVYSSVSYRDEYRTEQHLDGSSTTYVTTIKTTTTRTENYNFDAYARNVGPFLAIGPRVTFNNHEYSGQTLMMGLGFHARMPMFGSDFMCDFGKLGFASSFQNLETISNPKPDGNKIDKNDIRFTGTYNAARVGARGSIDLYELLMKYAYKGHSSDAGANATKFTRIMGGIGGGYAFISKPLFNRSYASHYKDSLYNADYTLLTTSYNDARFAESTPYFTWFIGIEVGAIQFSWEWYRYKYAPLANVQTVTLGYMLPYKRLIKRYKALHSMKKQLRD